ncbi:MAG: hypothetical protein WCQ54_10200 [Clostridiaceae bacterium]
MVSEELKMTVAQNCSGYRPRSVFLSMSMGTLSESCNNCANFIHGKCAKGLFTEIEREITHN